MKFFKDFRENQNDSTVFVTFTNTRDHFGFIKTFDNALFGEFNGRTKNIYVRANGFTNQERYYDDLSSVHFIDMRQQVRHFNTFIFRPFQPLINDGDERFLTVPPIESLEERGAAVQRQLQVIRENAINNNNNNINNNIIILIITTTISIITITTSVEDNGSSLHQHQRTPQ